MPIAYVQDLAEGQEKVNDATLTLSAIGTPTVTVGNKIFVAFCTDSQAGTNVSTLTDNLGNAYEEAAPARQLTDFTTFCWFAPVTVGGTLTSISLTLTNSNTAKAGVAGEYTGVDTWNGVEGSESASNSTTVAATPPASANYDLSSGQMLVGALGSEGPDGDTYTGISGGSPARTPSIRRKLGTTGGGPGSNVTVALVDVIADVAITDHKLSATISNARDNAGNGAIFNAAAGAALIHEPLVALQAVNRSNVW